MVGLKDKPKCGRTPHLTSEIVRKIRKKLTESKQGWCTEQVNDMIVEESGIQYHYTHVYRLLHKWEFKQKSTKKCARQYCVCKFPKCYLFLDKALQITQS